MVSFLKGFCNPVWKRWLEVPSATMCSKQQQQEGQIMWLEALSRPVLRAPRTQTPLPLLATCSALDCPYREKGFPLFIMWAPPVSAYTHTLPSCRLALLQKAWLHLLSALLGGRRGLRGAFPSQ